MTAIVDRAREFVLLNGRLMDRFRFAASFDDAGSEPVVRALRAYQNEDGGFGNGIDPDVRGPSSQPIGAEQALRILDEVGYFDSEIVDRLCDWCNGAATTEGGLPFALESITDGPRAPWWQPSTDASLNPTASIVGLLHRAGVAHDWLNAADDFCRTALTDGISELTGHEALCVLEFLRTPSDPTLATGAIGSHLRALQDAQAPDGGWPISWEPPTGAAASEWRGIVTINSLLVLRDYDFL